MKNIPKNPSSFKLFTLLFLLASSFQPLTSLYAEDVKISTYYPSPYGSYKHLSIEDDGASSSTSYGSLQIIRKDTGHFGSHLAFIRNTATPKIMGLGYKQSSDTFGFGQGVNTTSGSFDPTTLSIDSSGNVGIGTSTPVQKLAVQGTLGILEGGASPTLHTIFQGGDQTTNNITYTLPAAQGAASTVLANDGTGVLTWSPPAGGSSSFTTNGYASLPGGLIIQWGQYGTTSTAAGTYTVTFPIAFPTACLQVVGTPGDIAQTGGSSNVVVGSLSRTTFDVYGNIWEFPVRWIAIGH